MADLIISTKKTTPQSLTVTSAQENLDLQKKGSVVINLKGEYDPSSEDMREYAVQSTTDTTTSNVITLNGAISITDKTTDQASASASHNTYGLYVANTATTGSAELHITYTATIKTDNASTIKATRDTTSTSMTKVYGIGAIGTNTFNSASLIFDGGNQGTGKFQDAITVSATNSNKTDAGAIYAYGINSNTTVTFNDEMAAAIKVTATNKSKNASAYGIFGSSAVSFNDDISKDISATATGSATAAALTQTYAYGISVAAGDMLIGSEENPDINLNGKISATATGNAVLTADKKNGYGSNAGAYAIKASSFTMYGDIRKDITATATANSVTTGTAGKLARGGKAYAYGIQTTGNGNLEINGAINAAVKVTATAKADTATAKAITSVKDITITDGITKDISATATGSTQSSTTGGPEAYAISADKGTVTIGDAKSLEATDLAGAITAKATGNSWAKTLLTYVPAYAHAYGVTGTSVTINGNVTKAVTATASATGTTGGEADAVGMEATSEEGDLAILGGISGAVKVTATAKSDDAYAYGFYSKGSLSIGTDKEIASGISGAVTVTATGAGAAEQREESDVFGIAIGAAGDITIKSAVEDKKGNVNAITGAITAKATGNAALDLNKEEGYLCDASAAGILSQKSTVTITGNVTKAISATATANSVKDSDGNVIGGAATATGIAAKSTDCEVKIEGAVSGAITATATAKANSADAYGIASQGGTVEITKGVSAAVSATATGAATYAKKMAMYAYAIYAKNNLTIGGDLAGAVTVTATGNATQDTTEVSEAYAGDSTAVGIFSKSGDITINGNITKAITAKATSNAALSKDKTSAGCGTASAGGIRGKALTITGVIKGGITATATANSVKDASKNVFSGIAEASGIVSIGKLSVDGAVGKVTATATAKGSAMANAYGIYVAGGEIALTGSKGEFTATVNATASSLDNSSAIGIQGFGFTWTNPVTERTDIPYVMVTVTATSKVTNTKEAYASSKAIALDMSAATSDTTVTLLKSKLTATSAKLTGVGATSEAYSVLGSGNKEYVHLSVATLVGDISLDDGDDTLIFASGKVTGDVDMGAGNDTMTFLSGSSNKLTGDIDMGAGNDTLTLGSGNKITSTVDMGEGSDTIKIYSGAQIKGDLNGVENWDMVIEDAKGKGTTMWEGENAEITNYALEISSAAIDNLKSGKDVVFNLMKDTDGSVDWSSSTKVSLTLDGGTAMNLYYGSSTEDASYTYELEGVTKGKTTTMQLTVTKK